MSCSVSTNSEMKYLFNVSLLLSLISCKNDLTMMTEKLEKNKHTNTLINETSPYLLQHAHNPVDWMPWGEEALQKAKREDKMLLISIGYSACHWCHVMEKESFENEEVAKVMNEHFVCIKVDREEHPDVDQIYMDAVQLIGGNGGWPLNCFALPDGKPFWGGTYFPKAQWIKILEKVHSEYTHNRGDVLKYAHNLTQGIQQSDAIKLNTEPKMFPNTLVKDMVGKWKTSFDNVEGGRQTEYNKFPLPNNYLFLLAYGELFKDNEVLHHVKLTLDKMAYGGVYDQLGGGFARYSVDQYWKVPHFEKMLYDNAQLVRLYSNAYQKFRDDNYKRVVYETLSFVESELTDPSGAFYSALDADSEGEEGKFYVWKKEELQSILKDDFELFSDYFNVNQLGLWEHGNYILLRDRKNEEIAKKHHLTENELLKRIEKSKKELLDVRNKRTRPGLDDKCLTSWNALMIQGYTEAYKTFSEDTFLHAALKNAEHLATEIMEEEGKLFRSYKNGEKQIDAYLDDYAFTIEAFTALYEVTFDTKWLDRATLLVDYCYQNFYDASSNMFFYTHVDSKTLVVRKKELTDNVIPASNSSMARGLFYLGTLLENQQYLETSKTMLNNMKDYMPRYGSGYSNWGIVYLYQSKPFYEVAIVGKEAQKVREAMSKKYIPNSILLGKSIEEETLPLLNHKYTPEDTYIYICENKTCQKPTKNISEAMSLIE